MITGNITKTSRCQAADCAERMWCPKCREMMAQGLSDESFDDQFGLVTDWAPDGLCEDCGTEMEESKPDWDAQIEEFQDEIDQLKEGIQEEIDSLEETIQELKDERDANE
jgi:hypothetical protein